MAIGHALGLIVLLFAVASLPWLRTRTATRRFPGVPAQLRAQLGEPLASLLQATRELRGELLALERQTVQMLRDEIAACSANSRRPSGRELDDINLIPDVTRVRRMGRAWSSRAELIGASELGRRGIDLDGLAGVFELTWAVQELGVHSSDRSGEIRVLLDQCGVASDALARVDAALTSPVESPYRSG